MREWEIELEKEIVALFGTETYTRVDWAMRLELTPTEKWLHSFYHTHQDAYPYKVATLHELMGSKVKELRMFRFRLRAALRRLVDLGFFDQAKVDAQDLVHVTRKGRLTH